MTDKKGNELENGDMVFVRIFDEFKQTATTELAYIDGFRGDSHVIVNVRKGRKPVYVFNSKVVEKITKEDAMIFLLEN